MRYSDGERLERWALLFYSLYAIGLTVGGTAARGEGGFILTYGSELRYVAAAILRNLPFFAAASMPGKRSVRFVSGMVSAIVFGLLAGISGVQALVSAEPAGAFMLCVLPKIIISVPIFILELCINQNRGDVPFSYHTVFLWILRAFLVAISVSCVQFAIFFVFTQFN